MWHIAGYHSTYKAPMRVAIVVAGVKSPIDVENAKRDAEV
jgi:hypothetical protein